MRRLWLLVLITLAVLGASCGDDDATPEPTVPSVDFTPGAYLVVDGRGISCEVITGPESCTVDPGTVIEARNDGTDARRLRSDLFDTGIMKPGEVTTIVVSSPGDHDVYDVDDPSVMVMLTVTEA